MGRFGKSFAVLSIMLFSASGCSLKYDVLRGSRFANPPRQPIPVTVEGLDRFVVQTLRQEQVAVLADLRGQSTVDLSETLMQVVDNPFRVVTIDQQPSLLITGSKTTERERSPGLKYTDTRTKARRLITFQLTVTELATDKTLLDRRVTRAFSPSTEGDSQLLPAVYLAMLLESSPL